MNFEASHTSLEGPYGRAFRVELPDQPDAAETVCAWIVNSPIWHPAWSQYQLSVARLRFDVPGLPDPVLRFPGATHELVVVVIDPTRGPWTRTKIVAHNYAIPILVPVNICEQFTASDAEMTMLAALCVAGILQGALNPEVSDAPAAVREAWLASMVKTLAHMRGEEHAR